MGGLFPGAVPLHETVTCSLNATTKCSAGVTVSPGDATGRREADAPSVLPRPSVSGSGETPGATVTGGNLRARRDQQTVTMTRDRKSTRLNSSHLGISYAVFCLK